VNPHLLTKKKRKSTPSPSQKEMMDSTVGRFECHCLLPNKNINGNRQIRCYVCSLLEKPRKTTTSCVQCGKGFHIECFAAYHHTNGLDESTKALKTIITSVEEMNNKRGKVVRKRKSERISSLKELKI